MKRFFAAGIGACIMLAAASALAQAPAKAPTPAQQPQGQLPAHTSNPAELPKIFGVSVRVADLARAERFYREAMGATKSTQLTPREVSVSFPSGLGINLALAAADAAKGDGAVGFVFQTLDIDGLVKRTAAAGGKVVRQPSDGKATGGVRVAFVSDPDGARIEVIQFPAG